MELFSKRGGAEGCSGLEDGREGEVIGTRRGAEHGEEYLEGEEGAVVVAESGDERGEGRDGRRGVEGEEGEGGGREVELRVEVEEVGCEEGREWGWGEELDRDGVGCSSQELGAGGDGELDRAGKGLRAARE